jgi:NAD(P)-dependent dehydrogenase (short-subunit alcohol dehydrogenase family)
MGKFDGKSVVVTGAASGVGKETVLGFVAEGAKVFGIDINAEGQVYTGRDLPYDLQHKGARHNLAIVIAMGGGH